MYDFGFGGFLKIFLGLLIISPFAIWKIIEVILWLFNHVHILVN